MPHKLQSIIATTVFSGFILITGIIGILAAISGNSIAALLIGVFDYIVIWLLVYNLLEGGNDDESKHS